MWSTRSNLHFNQSVQFILNSTNFNLKIFSTIDDTRMEIITQKFVNTTSVKLSLQVWVYTFLCRFYANSLKYASNFSNSEATQQLYWIWVEIQIFNDNYENVCWHGGYSSYLVATRQILTFAPCWIWCQIHFLLENLWSYMKTWLKYVLCGGH